MNPPRKKQNRSQQLLLLFRENPKERKSLPELFEQAELPDLPENQRRLNCCASHAGRRLLYEDEQLLLHDADGYWIAQPRIDRVAAEKYAWAQIKKADTADKRRDQIIRVLEKCRLSTKERLRVMKASIYFGRRRSGS